MYKLKSVFQLLAVDTDLVESQYGGRRHVVSYNIIMFVPKVGTLPYLIVFLISTF